MIISLGGSCDVADQLKRRNINCDRPNFFFDYLWNEVDGLRSVSRIIKDGFKAIGDPANHTRTREHPISIYKNRPFSVCMEYPNIVFMHHNTTDRATMDSIKRKISRTKEAFESTEPKTFIYYRHYHWDFNLVDDLSVILEESREFCKVFREVYGGGGESGEDRQGRQDRQDRQDQGSHFNLVSLVVYRHDTDPDVIQREMQELDRMLCESCGGEPIRFDYVFRKDEKIAESVKKHEQSWDMVIDKVLEEKK